MANYCADNIARRSAVPKLGEGRRPLSRSLDKIKVPRPKTAQATGNPYLVHIWKYDKSQSFEK